MDRKPFFLLLCCTCVLPVGAVAAEPDPYPLSTSDRYGLNFNGFVSQGYFNSSSSSNNFNRSGKPGGSFDFTEAAANMHWQWTDRMSFAAQALYRKAPASVDDGVRLDYAFVNTTFQTPFTDATGVMIGRFKNPFGFYNETRDVPFTRPGIILPQSMYTERGRPFAMSSQGILVYGDLYRPWGTLGLKLSFGEPVPGGSSLEYIIFNKDLPGEFEPRRAITAQLRYDGPEPQLGWSAALSYQEYSYDLTKPRASLGLDSFRFSYKSVALSLQYAEPDWKITSESSRGVAFDDAVRLTTYLQGDYRILPDLSVFARADLMILDNRDRWGKKAEAAGRGPDYNRYAKDYSIGMNWEPRPDLSLRLEWHHTIGNAFLSSAENDLLDAAKTWNMGMAQISYRF